MTTPSGTAPLTNLWYTRCPVPTALGIAIQRGLYEHEFRPEGLVLKSLQESRDPTEQRSHFDHTLAHSFRQGGNIPALWARSQGRATRVIGLSWSDEFQGLIALGERGLTRARDLRDLRIGLPRRDIAIDFTRAAALRGAITALALDGLAPRDVEWVDLPDFPIASSPGALGSTPAQPVREYTQEVRALVRGEVDAIFVKGVAGLETAHQIGAVVIAQTGLHPDPQVRIGNGTPRTLTVDQGLLDTHPDIVARFLARTQDAGDWAAANPGPTQAYIAHETHSRADWVRFAYGEDVHEHLRTNLDEAAVAGLTAFKDFLLAWKFLPADIDISAWLAPQIHEAAAAYRSRA